MPAHTIAPTTQTLELRQIAEINARLRQVRAAELLRADDLGVGGTEVIAGHVDAVAAHLSHLPQHVGSGPRSSGIVSQEDRLLQLVAVGSPIFPYIYGLFGSGRAADSGRGRLLPVTLHTAQLQQISKHFRMHHHWGP
jgi:hypothetical protein